MHLAIDRLSTRRGRDAALMLTAALVAILVGAAPALADVRWHITMTHANPYGRLGARDPYTISAKTFARESTGDTYTITVRNEGTEASQPEPVVVADQLPAGMVLTDRRAVTSPKQNGNFLWNNDGNCTIVPETLPGGEEIHARGFECKTSSVVNPGESLPPIVAEVAVNAQAAPPVTNVATLTNTATVQGGGGPPAQTAQQEGETTITPAVPFGIDSFAVHVGQFSHLGPAEELEFEETRKIKELDAPTSFTPFNNAGGHPPSLTSDLVYHFVPFVEEVEQTAGSKGGGPLTLEAGFLGVQPAGGKTKEVQVDVPPGFLGNVLGMPRCPVSALFGGACPPDTAVGWTAVDLNSNPEPKVFHEGVEARIPYNKVNEETGEIEGGEPELIPRLAGRLELFGNATTEAGRTTVYKVTSSAPGRAFVYNMQPTPGNPAEFGFAVAGQPILLEVRVRSDGDYGVTVGDNAAGGTWPATDLTMCENGAEVVKVPPEGKKPKPVEVGDAWFKCKPLTAGSKPFLTNPTECSAPTWTVHTNSYPEPQTYASKSVGVNVEAERVTRATHETVNEGTAGELIEGSASPLTGCDQLQFNPQFKFGPNVSSEIEGATTQADAPTGEEFALTVPQEEGQGSATPALKSIRMTLPKGMTVSPSAANGLQACTKAQFWPSKKAEDEEASNESPVNPEAAKSREPAVAAKCPQASQIATAEVFTPLLSGEPTAAGPTEGRVTCSEGMWSGGPWSQSFEQRESGVEEVENGSHERLKLSYQWLRGGVSIVSVGTPLEVANAIKRGAIAREYTLGTEDFGKAIQCQVTARNDGGSSAAVGQAVFPEPPPATLPIPPAGIAAPSGEAAVGKELTCQSGQWVGVPTPTHPFTYRWLRGGASIAGAEGQGYTLRPEDSGQVIQCQVIGKTDEGTVAIADSAAVPLSPAPSPLPPLPAGALQGAMFVGQPECSPCTNEDAENGKLFPLFIQLQNKLQLSGNSAGLLVKLQGATHANATTGQLTSVFEGQPQQPFYMFDLKLKGGPRASLANPQTCGSATTNATLEPWGAPEAPDATSTSSFTVGAGEPCPSTLPFAPSFNAGTAGASAATAGASTDFSVTFGRQDREQDLSALTMHMPLGLVGKIPAVQLCGEAEALAEEQEAPTEGHSRPHCPPESKIGEATSVAGPGSDPFEQKGGEVYLTGPYDGAPFGILTDTPAEAGPFNLGHVVVRSTITIDPNTAAVTVTTPTLPQIVSGVPLRLREIHVDVNKPGFMVNPTNCNEQQVSATLGGLQGANASVSSKFGITGCKNLPFHPNFTASTQAHTSKLGGASLNVKITYPQGAYANIAQTVTALPAQLPSRLETLQKACVDTVFEANPAACPEGSVVGMAIAHTPVLNQALAGPAYLVSHGGAAFPDLELVLQGEGVKVVLDGQTDIKKGITKTTFNAVPDSPVETFELSLPEGPHSVLAANGNLCAQPLSLPTELVGQNGAVIKQNTNIAVTGCPPTVAITNTKLKGNALLVTVKMSAKGNVTISGKGLKTTTKKNLKAGTHQIRVALTKTGRTLHKHHKKTSVRVKLTVGKQVVARVASVRL